jgi:hypothetical protein
MTETTDVWQMISETGYLMEGENRDRLKADIIRWAAAHPEAVERHKADKATWWEEFLEGERINKCGTTREEVMTNSNPPTFIDDIDVFDSARALIADGVDLDDRAEVERELINPYQDDKETSARFVNWCIKAARANLDAGSMTDDGKGFVEGFVPPE